jgi:hypothetical protein
MTLLETFRQQCEELEGVWDEELGICKFPSEAKKPLIYCQSEEISCDDIIRRIRKYDLPEVEEIYIAPTKWFLKEFEGDEMVRYRLVEEKRLGMTRNRDAHELDPEVPRQILAVTDHPNYRLLYKEEIEDQIILTVLHEHAHLKGIESEAKAEREAERSFAEVEGRYPLLLRLT